MGISSAHFLNKMGYASTKIKDGISSVTIASETKNFGRSKKVIECSAKLMLVLTESEKENELLNVALMYLVNSNTDGDKSTAISKSFENNRFESICRQMIFALDNNMSNSEAEKTLKSIGIYGNMLDGIQRSSSVNGYRCMLKLSPGGMIMMVISKI